MSKDHPLEEISPKHFSKLDILYEDNHLFAVYKPPGILTCGDQTGDLSLLDISKAWIKREYNKPGNVFLAMVHRLDRRTEGVLLFCKTSKAASRISQQFRQKKVKKVYLALVQGVPQKSSATYSAYLRKEKRKSKVYTEKVKGSKWAEISYTLLETKKNAALLEVQPTTGRFHQIRSMLAHLGHPILADVRYGGPSMPFPQGGLGLQCQKMTIQHPTHKTDLTIKAPLPQFCS